MTQLEVRLATFTWLHLTDLHCGLQPQNWLWPRMHQVFLDDLSVLHDECGPWDLVLFSGDMTQRGGRDEFAKVDEILERLWIHMRALGSTPVFFAVPGNHDIERPDPETPEVLLLNEWVGRPNVQERFWSRSDSAYRKVVDQAFHNYSDWWNGNTLRPAQVRQGLLPGDFSATINKQSLRIGLVGLNTTFLQLTAADYRGRLALHPLQFQSVCGNDNGPVRIPRDGDQRSELMSITI
ncbi:MAG: metallophosphoesterase, partial [Bryobacteraceae bacterium]